MDNILSTTKFVCDNSVSVQINQAKLSTFAESYVPTKTSHWSTSSPFDISRLSFEEQTMFFLLLATQAFCFWGEPKWTIEYNNQTYSGTYGVIMAIVRAAQEGTPLFHGTYLESITKENVEYIFRGNTTIPLIESRQKHWKELGSVIVKKYNNSYTRIFERTEYDATKMLTTILEDFPSFNDTSTYKGKTIYFQKRAQLLVSDLAYIAPHPMKNVQKLTALADYKIPMVLRNMGILEYSPKLAQKVDAVQEIPHGAPEEVEIRANMVWAVEYITKIVQKKYPEVIRSDINTALWLQGKKSFKNPTLHHRTRTAAY